MNWCAVTCIWTKSKIVYGFCIYVSSLEHLNTMHYYCSIPSVLTAVSYDFSTWNKINVIEASLRLSSCITPPKFVWGLLTHPLCNRSQDGHYIAIVLALNWNLLLSGLGQSIPDHLVLAGSATCFTKGQGILFQETNLRI